MSKPTKSKLPSWFKRHATDKVKLTDDDYDKIEGAITVENIKKQAKKVSMIKIILFLLAIVISLLISIQDVAVSVVAATADCALVPVTAGIAGLVTGAGALGDEVISELIQSIIIALTMIFLSGGSRKSMIIRVLIIGGCSLIDIVLSIISVFIPCILDAGAAIVEIGTEIIQNAVFIYSFFQMF